MPTKTVEDYLKAIYRLGGEAGEAVALGKLACELSVTPGTVTTMVRRLDEGDGLVSYRKRVGASLTGSGRREALRVVRRHRMIELFLVRMVGLGWDEVHEEAERLEHALSDRLVERIAELLGQPDYDPHGTPIPDVRGELPEEARLKLSEVGAGAYLVVGFSPAVGEVRVACERRGIRHGQSIEVVSNDRAADVVRVLPCGDELGAGEVVLGRAAAACVIVLRREDATSANTIAATP